MPDATANWMRQLAQLRTRALRVGLRRPGSQSPMGEVLEDALTASASLLKEFADAQVDCERSRADVAKRTAAWEHLFDVMPGACVATDADGVIHAANRAAGELFNLTARRLQNRPLVVFTDDRERFSGLIRQLVDGTAICRAPLTVRPRERRPIDTEVVVTPLSPSQRLFLWFFVPRGGAQMGAREDAWRQSA